MQIRAARRIAEGRAKPIDIITKDLFNLGGWEDDDDDEDDDGYGRRRNGGNGGLTEPYKVFEGLLLEDLQDLYDDIRAYKVSTLVQNIGFWIVCSWCIACSSRCRLGIYTGWSVMLSEGQMFGYAPAV